MARKQTKPETEANGVAVMEPPDDASRPAGETPTEPTDDPTTAPADAAESQPGALPTMASPVEFAEPDDEADGDDHLADAGKVIDETVLEAIDYQIRVHAKAKCVARLQVELRDAAEVHKRAKKAWESASEELTEMAAADPASHPLPLIDGAKARAAEAGKAAEPKADEAWRNDPISILELTASLTEKLEDAGFKTVGHLADWSSKGNRLEDIPGVGEKTAEKIADALEFYWAARDKAAVNAEPEVGVIEVGYDPADDDETE